MNSTRLHWSGWLLRVLTYDGLVPLAVFASSVTLTRLAQGQGDWYVIVSVGIPLLAFFVRYLMGLRSICENHCQSWMRAFQKVVLVIGLIVVAILDCLLICLSALPPPQGGNADKIMILCCGAAIVYLAYMACMAFAMYPGREPIPPCEDPDFNPDRDEW